MTLPTNHTALLQEVPADGGSSQLEGATLAPSGSEPQGYASGGGSAWPQIALFGSMIFLFYFLLIRPQQRQRKQLEEKLSKLKSGDEVLLTSGIYATIDRVDGHLLFLKMGNNIVKARRNAVAALSTEVDAAAKKPSVFS